MEKNSFVMYTKYEKHINKLNMEQRGMLLTAIMAYTNGGEIPELDLATDILFGIIADDIDACNQRYEETKKARSAAGKKSAQSRSESNKDEEESAKGNKAEQKSTNANKAEQTPTKSTVNDNENVNDNDLKDKKKKAQQAAPVPRTTMQFFEKLKSDYSFSERMQQELGTWFKYKTERREPYKETGMKKFLTQISHEIEKNGEDKVIDAFEWSMSNGWKGFYYRKEDKARGQPQKKIPYNDFQQREYDYADLERQLANL